MLVFLLLIVDLKPNHHILYYHLHCPLLWEVSDGRHDSPLHVALFIIIIIYNVVIIFIISFPLLYFIYMTSLLLLIKSKNEKALWVTSLWVVVVEWFLVYPYSCSLNEEMPTKRSTPCRILEKRCLRLVYPYSCSLNEEVPSKIKAKSSKSLKMRVTSAESTNTSVPFSLKCQQVNPISLQVDSDNTMAPLS